MPEHTRIPVKREAAHPHTGDGTLPDDRYTRTLDPWVALATAAVVTSRITLATAVALPTESDPITLAKTIATLDHLSGGRVTIGAGFGWNTDELADHGVPADRRRTVLREYIEAMRALWTQEEAAYDGEFVTFGPCWAFPKPAPGDLGDGNERYDVVVIGFGIAGGSAALTAARAGARVLLLERAAVHGGTTGMAGGHFYLGGGTAVQRATGHQDSAEEMYKYLVAVAKDPEHDKIRAYCEGSVAHFDWLESLGFEFERSFFPGRAVIQPGTEGLMFTANEKVWPFRDQARPAPRGHKVPSTA